MHMRMPAANCMGVHSGPRNIHAVHCHTLSQV